MSTDPSPVDTVQDQPSADGPPDDELVVLEQLESDLAAVEQAITTLEAISSDGSGGDAAAAEIAAAVSSERFGGPDSATTGSSAPAAPAPAATESPAPAATDEPAAPGSETFGDPTPTHPVIEDETFGDPAPSGD